MTKDGKVAVGIIGFGGIARGAHLTSGYRKLPDWCEVVAAADILPERCAQASGQYGIPETYATHTELLERDDIDAVSVCTGNYAHAQITIDALRAGKNVLCEKPMAMNAEECKAMIAAQRETGKKLQIGFNMRYSPGAQSLKRAVEAGEFGEIYHAAARAIRRRRVPSQGVFINKKLNGGGPLPVGIKKTNNFILWNFLQQAQMNASQMADAECPGGQ